MTIFSNRLLYIIRRKTWTFLSANPLRYRKKDNPVAAKRSVLPTTSTLTGIFQPSLSHPIITRSMSIPMNNMNMGRKDPKTDLFSISLLSVPAIGGFLYQFHYQNHNYQQR